MENSIKLIVGISPHIKSKETVSRMMLDVIIALLPAMFFSIYFFGLHSIGVISVSIMFCILTEFITCKIVKRKTTIADFSAIVTGLLLAFCLPPSIPLWMVAVGSVFCIIVGKQIFGGLGYNPFNPALVGRAFLQVSWPAEMSRFISPYDSLTSATPLSITKLGLEGIVPSNFELFIGQCAGALGETSKFALLLGAIYLLARKQIKLYTPVSFIFSAIVLCAIFHVDVIFHIFSGGLILGAFFMSTDPVTTPITNSGKIVFGFGCGLLTMLIRLKGGFPEGVCYSILIMNMFTPFIDKITKPKGFGR
ncbi:MAG: RnfABCDGE type electron transport complex subunit D [Elusimicrobiota bacterium]|nr:RnfABCDGE type electron transport complex subunit D [Elusimicrobiota bacterium]